MTAPPVNVEALDVDVAIVGSGGAGLMAAIHAIRAGPALRVAILSKVGLADVVRGSRDAGRSEGVGPR